MNIDFSLYQNTTLVTMLVVLGAFLKHCKITNKIPNKFIPYILMVVSIAVNILLNGFELSNIAVGVISGATSVGIHQAGKISAQLFKDTSDEGDMSDK